MINSKVSAFRKIEDNWVKISRWDLLKLSEVDYLKFMDANDLYLSKTEESPKLTFNRLQKTFRFYPNKFDYSERESSGLTISHLLAQEVLSELETLNIVLDDNRFKPKITKELKIKVDNSIIEYPLFDRKYIADLIIFFSSPYEEATNWNKRFVLEVYVTNKVRGDKIAMFEEKGYGLIEVKLGNRLLNKKKISEITEKEENDLKRYIYNSFKKQIFCDLLVSPFSEESSVNLAIQEKNSSIEKLQANLRDVQAQNLELKKDLKQTIKRNNELEENINKIQNLMKIERLNNQKHEEQLKLLGEKVKKLENPSLATKFKLIFK